jgi:hypothetical protein
MATSGRGRECLAWFRSIPHRSAKLPRESLRASRDLLSARASLRALTVNDAGAVEVKNRAVSYPLLDVNSQNILVGYEHPLRSDVAKGADESRTGLGVVADNRVIVSEVEGVDDRVSSVDWRPARQSDMRTSPCRAFVCRYPAKSRNLVVEGVGTAIVPAGRHFAGFIHAHCGLEVIRAAPVCKGDWIVVYTNRRRPSLSAIAGTTDENVCIPVPTKRGFQIGIKKKASILPCDVQVAVRLCCRAIHRQISGKRAITDVNKDGPSRTRLHALM